MGTPSEVLTELLRTRLAKREIVNIQCLVDDLDRQGVEPEEAFEQLLRDAKAFNWHYYAVAGMRTLAERDRLSQDKATTLLNNTERLAWQLGTDEFHKTIVALARSKKTAPALLEFVQKRLLEQQDIPEWRWLAFTAVASMRQSRTADITPTLKERLKREAEEEIDPHRKPQLQELVNSLLR